MNELFDEILKLVKEMRLYYEIQNGKTPAVQLPLPPVDHQPTYAPTPESALEETPKKRGRKKAAESAEPAAETPKAPETPAPAAAPPPAAVQADGKSEAESMQAVYKAATAYVALDEVEEHREARRKKALDYLQATYGVAQIKLLPHKDRPAFTAWLKDQMKVNA